MKKISKLKLRENADLLNDQEMKMILGGYGNFALFSCACDYSGAHSPFASKWTSYYFDSTAITDDISRRCVKGGGCRQI